MSHQRGMGFSKGEERLPVEGQAVGRLRGLGVRGPARLLVKQGELAERVTRRQEGKHDFFTLPAEVGDLHLPGFDQVERVSGITLAKDVAAPREAPRLEPSGKRLQLLRGKATEQRRARPQSDAV